MLTFNQVDLLPEEVDPYIQDVLYRSGLESDKYYVKTSNFLKNYTQSPSILLTQSCTAALEMIALLIEVQPGDEIIMPSFTYVSTANSFVLRGATPVFVDIREDTFNLDDNLIEAAITEKTKAIVAVHYAAVACDMVRIMAIAKRYGLYVIEDAAQCIGARYKGKHLGTMGHFGVFSFHYTKNITSGFGGALCVNEPSFIKRATRLSQKGTNRDDFLNGQVDKYTWVDVGSSFMMSELTAALLYSQLQQLGSITAKRFAIWQRYEGFFRACMPQLKLPFVPVGCEHNGHLFYVLCSSNKKRERVIHKLKHYQIQAVSHYQALHLSPAGKKFGRYLGSLEVSQWAAECLLRLPLFSSLVFDETYMRALQDALSE